MSIDIRPGGTTGLVNKGSLEELASFGACGWLKKSRRCIFKDHRDQEEGYSLVVSCNFSLLLDYSKKNIPLG